eukprot:SAG31_NODE_906_length_11091_cov_22.589065_6_plen_80_part_00
MKPDSEEERVGLAADLSELADGTRSSDVVCCVLLWEIASCRPVVVVVAHKPCAVLWYAVTCRGFNRRILLRTSWDERVK